MPSRVWERAQAKIDTSGECWPFTGALNDKGYARIQWVERGQRRSVLLHRAMYEAHIGPIPDGLQIDHLCRNRACVNPEHLEPVDQRTNVLRGIGPTAVHAAKTHCIHGHPLVEGNLLPQPNRWRKCRECARRRGRELKRRQRAARRLAAAS